MKKYKTKKELSKSDTHAQGEWSMIENPFAVRRFEISLWSFLIE